MFYCIQKEKKGVEPDVYILQDVLNKQKYIHEYTMMSLEEMQTVNGFTGDKEAIPVGTIEFVSAFLKNIKGINDMNPIEVPVELRKLQYLNRQYSIIDASEIPKYGRWFIKDASKLKGFSYSGNIEHANIIYDGNKGMDDELNIHVDNSQPIVLSELVNILSEYRVFVEGKAIVGIQYYDGDVTIMPTPYEISVIKEMVRIYTSKFSRDYAFTFDIAIIEEENDRSVALIEVHPFVSVGLYGLASDNLPYMYRLGFDYYLCENTPLTK